jgi:hypothetical protein
MYLASSAGSYSNFSLPRDKVSSYNAIKVTIGAENFGTLVKITDDPIATIPVDVGTNESI